MKSTICVTAQPLTINDRPSTTRPWAFCLALGLCVVGLTTSPATQAATRYVDLNSPTPAAPYTTWATAATTIQAAVDAAAAGDEIVVTNGTYASIWSHLDMVLYRNELPVSLSIQTWLGGAIHPRFGALSG